jgi:hypothetical protein
MARVRFDISGQKFPRQYLNQTQRQIPQRYPIPLYQFKAPITALLSRNQTARMHHPKLISLVHKHSKDLTCQEKTINQGTHFQVLQRLR